MAWFRTDEMIEYIANQWKRSAFIIETESKVYQNSFISGMIYYSSCIL